MHSFFGSRMRATFAAGATLLAFASIASAQTPGAPPSEVNGANVDASATAQAATDTSGDILVTAQRRSQSIQKVPVAITALDPATLAKADATNVESLQALVPGLVALPSAGSSNSAAIYIRGMGQDGSTIFDEPGVAIYIDGVYLGRPIGSLFDLVGVERIEVLRGPQGTLYGRNSNSGAIKVVTRRPTTDRFFAEGDVTLGSFDRFDMRALVNLPLTDTLAATVSGSSITNNGYYKNSLTGERYNKKDTQTVRASLLWTPDSPISVYVTADLTHDHSGLQVPTEMMGKTPPLNGEPLFGSIYETRPDVPNVNNYYGGGGSVELNYDLGNGNKIQSISAYRKFNYHINLDENGTVGLDLLRHTRQNQISEELQYSGTIGERLNFVLGGFFFREKAYESILFDFALSPLFTYTSHQTSTSYAAFAQADYKILDWLTLTAGGRFSHDKKVVDRFEPFVTSGEKSWSRFTPKVGLSAQVDPNLLVYANFAKGYKAGVFQPFPSLDQANIALNPEETTAYEAGVKAQMFDRKLTANISVFNNTYKNLQLGVVAGNGAVAIASADLRSRGVEVELNARPFDGLLLFTNFSYMGTKFTALPPAGDGLPVAGDKQKLTPPFSGRAGFDYAIPVLNADKLTFGASATWQTKNYQQYPNYLFPSKPYTLFDARVAYDRRGGPWGIEAGVKNIGNVHYWNYSSQLAGFERFYQPGRTFYVRLKFGI
jgi:iron complex outermembrane receptor protein